MNPAAGENFTEGEQLVFGVLTDLHEQNQRTENPMFGELGSLNDAFKKGNKRWAAVVAGLLMLGTMVYDEPKPSHEQNPKAPAGETTNHTPGALIDR